MAAFMSNFIEAGPGANEGKKALYHCNYCNKDISGKIRIKCTKCPDFDLCVECFSVGAEVTPHKSNHPYRVMVGTNTTISSLTCSWSLIWYNNFCSFNVESFKFLRLQVGCIFSFFIKKLVWNFYQVVFLEAELIMSSGALFCHQVIFELTDIQFGMYQHRLWEGRQ